jgi:hypothetical protein
MQRYLKNNANRIFLPVQGTLISVNYRSNQAARNHLRGAHRVFLIKQALYAHKNLQADE